MYDGSTHYTHCSSTFTIQIDSDHFPASSVVHSETMKPIKTCLVKYHREVRLHSHWSIDSHVTVTGPHPLPSTIHDSANLLAKPSKCDL